MRTLEQCKTDIATLNRECSELVKNNNYAEARRKEKKAEAIRECILYLEKEPREEFVKAEVKRLEKMINNREEAVSAKYSGKAFEKWEKKTLNKLKNKLRTELGVAKLKEQLSNLNYILG